MADKIKLQVHHVRFFEHQPQTINCISLDKMSSRVAVSRSDASVEIYSTKDNWHQEMVFPGSSDASVESLVWAQGRLFAAGLGGNVVELDLDTLSYKSPVSSNAGPLWCLTTNVAEDQIAAGTEDGCVVLFDVAEDLQFLRGFGKIEGRILSIAWHQWETESMIVTGGINTIRQWSVKSGQPISRMTLGRQFNKDTIVWCVAVTKDFTIISGDSRGVVTFWNGKESTQIKTFHCHKADVLSLCLSQDGHRAFTGGVDGALFQFTLCTTAPSSERKRWVQQTLHTRHTHDIRALAYKDTKLISGGVDTSLLIAELKGQRAVREVAPFHPRGLVHTAERSNLIQLQYPTYIEIWQLGAAVPPNDEARGILPLSHKPIKLVELQAREGQQILCSAMSPEGLVAFSDNKGIRLYRLQLDKAGSSQPQVNLTRVKVNMACAARQMTLSPDGQLLCVVAVTGSVQVVSVATGLQLHRLQLVTESQVHRLAISPNSGRLALATLDHGVHLYDLHTGQHVCSCPTQSSQVCALAFSTDSHLLAIAYCNHKVYEFDVEKKEFSLWCRANSPHLPSDFLKPYSTIDHMSYLPGHPHLLAFHTNKVLCVLDKSKSLLEEKSDRCPGRKQGKPEALHMSLKYRYLLYAGFLSNGMLVAVERPPPAVAEALPPSFKVKKFGTS